jgi:hypothetical protein
LPFDFLPARGGFPFALALLVFTFAFLPACGGFTFYFPLGLDSHAIIDIEGKQMYLSNLTSHFQSIYPEFSRGVYPKLSRGVYPEHFEERKPALTWRPNVKIAVLCAFVPLWFKMLRFLLNG